MKIKYGLNSKEINSDTNYFIAVSKSEKKVYIYYNENDSWENIKVFICNIGSPENPTIEGNYTSGLKGKVLKIDDIYVKKSVEELKENLKELQYRGTQENATEPPFKNESQRLRCWLK